MAKAISDGWSPSRNKCGLKTVSKRKQCSFKSEIEDGSEMPRNPNITEISLCLICWTVFACDVLKWLEMRKRRNSFFWKTQNWISCTIRYWKACNYKLTTRLWKCCYVSWLKIERNTRNVRNCWELITPVWQTRVFSLFSFKWNPRYFPIC